MTSELLAVVIDCRDAERVAGFWRAALGYGETVRWQDARGCAYVEVRPVGAGGPLILCQPVDEPKSVKNRLHLDLAARGTQSEEVRRLVGLGARVLADDPEFPWVVLADPEGNEFCVLPPRRR